MIHQIFAIRLIALIPILMLLGGCVTETLSGKEPIEQQPNEAAEYNVQLGIGYLRQGDLPSAQRKLEKAVELNPSNVTAYRALGIVYQRLGDSEAANRMYRRAVELAPNDPDSLNSLAVYLCGEDAGRVEALVLFDKAIKVPQSKQLSNKAMLNTNAGICAKEGDLPRAEDYLRTALAFDSSFGEALLQMADVAYQRGNFLQARAFLERYAGVAPVSSVYLWLGMQIESAMGDARAADAFGARLREEFPASVETRLLLERNRDDG